MAKTPLLCFLLGLPRPPVIIPVIVTELYDKRAAGRRFLLYGQDRGSRSSGGNRRYFIRSTTKQRIPVALFRSWHKFCQLSPVDVRYGSTSYLRKGVSKLGGSRGQGGGSQIWQAGDDKL